MNPIAFTIFGFPVMWYGVLISTGMLLGLVVANYTCKIKNVSYDNLTSIILIAIPIGIIGARAYYVFFQREEYNNIWEMINIRGGGLAIHGGIIFGATAALIFCFYKKLDFLKYADVAAPSIILAQGIGRWGNFFNQEAHGGIVSKEFISHFPKFIQRGMYIEGNYYHPTFLYESIWNLLVFIILILILTKVSQKGLIFFTYIGLYSIGRFIIEGLRTDSLLAGSLRAAQVVSLIGITSWIMFIVYTLINRKMNLKI